MKLKLRKFFAYVWGKINFGNNKKKITIWFFSIILTVATLTILLVGIFSIKHDVYKGKTVFSIKDHLKDDGLKCEENKIENIYTCKRGPIVFTTNSKMIITSNSKDKKILEELTEWFYQNVPWGAEILHLREIIIGDEQSIEDNGLLKETWYMGKRWGGRFLSLKLYLAPFLKELETETKAYFDKTHEGGSLLVDTNPLEKVIDQIQYYLYREYVKMKINLYYEDFSTNYREGGWHDRAVLKKINLRSEAIYQERFNNSQKTNWRYPFKVGDLKDFGNYNKEYTLKDIYDMSNDLFGSTSNWSDKKPLFHLDKKGWEDNNKIKLIKSQSGKQAYFNGMDRGEKLTELELSVWEAEKLLDDYRNTFLNPILRDLNLPEFTVDGSIAEDNLVKLREFIKNDNLKQFHTNRKHLSSYQFAGYHNSWAKTFFEKVVLPVWNFNNKVIYNQNQKFIDVFTKCNENRKHNRFTNDKLIPPEFNITDDLKDKNNRYISHPDYPIELGAYKISQFNFNNQASFMVARDYQLLSMGFEPLAKDKSINRNLMATNIDNPFWLDVSLLQAFNAFPYDSKDVVDGKLLDILARLMRIDQDIAMTYKSQVSGFSYMWGYMPENANYNALVFKNGLVTKKIPIYQAKYQTDVSNNGNSIDFDHTFYLNNFMNRASKESLTKLMKRKAWITDWNLIDYFENAVLSTGQYTVSFEDKNGNLIPVKEYSFPSSLTSYQWKLNPWGDYEIFSGFQFYYDVVSKVVKLKVNPRSWVD